MDPPAIVFEGTGWHLLAINATQEYELDVLLPRTGYGVVFGAVFTPQGIVAGAPGYFPDLGPGAAIHVDEVGTLRANPNPQVGTGGIGTFVRVPPLGLALGGVHYAFIGVAGEVAWHSIELDPAWVVASGPMNFAWETHMDGGPTVEANAGIVGVATGGPRRLTFDVEDTLIGSFGPPARALIGPPAYYESGGSFLTLPNGTQRPCRCTYGTGFLPGAGTYTFEDNRTQLTQLRMPPAVWADVPISQFWPS